MGYISDPRIYLRLDFSSGLKSAAALMIGSCDGESGGSVQVVVHVLVVIVVLLLTC